MPPLAFRQLRAVCIKSPLVIRSSIMRDMHNQGYKFGFDCRKTIAIVSVYCVLLPPIPSDRHLITRTDAPYLYGAAYRNGITSRTMTQPSKKLDWSTSSSMPASSLSFRVPYDDLVSPVVTGLYFSPSRR